MATYPGVGRWLGGLFRTALERDGDVAGLGTARRQFAGSLCGSYLNEVTP